MIIVGVLTIGYHYFRRPCHWLRRGRVYITDSGHWFITLFVYTHSYPYSLVYYHKTISRNRGWICGQYYLYILFSLSWSSAGHWLAIYKLDPISGLGMTLCLYFCIYRREGNINIRSQIQRNDGYNEICTGWEDDMIEWRDEIEFPFLLFNNLRVYSYVVRLIFHVSYIYIYIHIHIPTYSWVSLSRRLMTVFFWVESVMSKKKRNWL